MITFEEARRDDFEYFEVELFATDETIDGFFSNARIDRSTVPAGWYAYDLREGDDGDIATIEHSVSVNHYGTFLTQSELPIAEGEYLAVEEDFDYTF